MYPDSYVDAEEVSQVESWENGENRENNSYFITLIEKKKKYTSSVLSRLLIIKIGLF
jgi:hypothetical protein